MKNIIVVILLLMLSCQNKDILEDVQRPIVETLPASNIASSTAVLGGEIISDGGLSVSSKGFYYWQENEPLQMIGNFSFQNNSSIYRSTVTGLKPNTVYFVEAWINNGLFLVAGDTVTFKTLD